MSIYTLVGDVHASFDKLQNIINKSNNLVIALGDVGIGFPYKKVNPLFHLDINEPYLTTSYTNFTSDPNKYKWISGNHDSTLPEYTTNHPNWLGRFGVFEGMFFVGGGFSIDRAVRTEGIDWWSNEELSMKECNECLELYEKTKPDILISHEGPTELSRRIYKDIIPNRTCQLLDAMLDIHSPSHHYFAHHHRSYYFEYNNTKFQCLNCSESITIDI